MSDFKILGRDVINIFCDASIKKANGITYGCPGSVVINNCGETLDYESTILVDSTNNESEIYAILLATRQAIKYKDLYNRINIFSDSRISVFGLREWMISWINKSKDGVLYSTSGEVANQQIFLQVVSLVLNNLDSYNLYHIDGHMNPQNPKDILTTISDFKKFNNKEINLIETMYLLTQNNLIDSETRHELSITDLASLNKLNRGIIYPIPSSTDTLTYKKILDI